MENILVIHTIVDIIILVIILCFVSIKFRAYMISFCASIKNLSSLLTSHIQDEEATLTSTEGKVVSLMSNVNNLHKTVDEISATLAINFIEKANTYSGEWEIVKNRLEETADVTFLGAYAACESCVGKCEYSMLFRKIIEERRKESFDLWERQAIPIHILKIVEQVDKELFPVVLQAYIPDILSVCTTRRLPLEKRRELVKQKAEFVSSKVKQDWEDAILKRIKLIDEKD